MSEDFRGASLLPWNAIFSCMLMYIVDDVTIQRVGTAIIKTIMMSQHRNIYGCHA